MYNFKVKELCSMTDIIREKAMRKMAKDIKYLMGTRGKEDIVELLTYELVSTQVKLEQLLSKKEKAAPVVEKKDEDIKDKSHKADDVKQSKSADDKNISGGAGDVQKGASGTVHAG